MGLMPPFNQHTSDMLQVLTIEFHPTMHLSDAGVVLRQQLNDHFGAATGLKVSRQRAVNGGFHDEVGRGEIAQTFLLNFPVFIIVKGFGVRHEVILAVGERRVTRRRLHRDLEINSSQYGLKSEENWLHFTAVFLANHTRARVCVCVNE